MEHVRVQLANDELFADCVHNSLPEAGDLMMVTKDRATKAGRPAVCLTFTVRMPSGEMQRVQCVVTGRNFANMAAAFRGRYGVDGDAVCTASETN